MAGETVEKTAADAVAGVLEHRPARRDNSIGEQRVMAGQRQPHIRPVIRPQPGRPFDISEEKHRHAHNAYNNPGRRPRRGLPSADDLEGPRVRCWVPGPTAAKVASTHSVRHADAGLTGTGRSELP